MPCLAAANEATDLHALWICARFWITHIVVIIYKWRETDFIASISAMCSRPGGYGDVFYIWFSASIISILTFVRSMRRILGYSFFSFASSSKGTLFLLQIRKVLYLLFRSCLFDVSCPRLSPLLLLLLVVCDRHRYSIQLTVHTLTAARPIL